ncbi:MAG: gamma-glutamyl-gamma-aminobutyrate hydrolase family protein [bacterium]|nr:gamma-glutamyl-gamma-aminobutyrate hydrolase family protein [bacterium]
MNRPVIGITPLIDYEKDSYWLVPGYMQGIIEAGGTPVMLPLTDDINIIRQMADKCSGFLFTGGQDVSPLLYGETPIPQCGECSTERDKMEKSLLERAIELNKPILGICRGIQLINAVLGGTLYQDLPSQINSPLEHHQKPPYDKPIHDVTIIENTPLHHLLRKEVLAVNSYHHQSVKDLSDKLLPMAKADDGIIEAVYMPDKKFVWGVQWHPEFSHISNADSRKIFSEFVKQAKGICS